MNFPCSVFEMVGEALRPSRTMLLSLSLTSHTSLHVMLCY